MTPTDRQEITKISKAFAKGILEGQKINGSAWIVVDPLSAYLNFCGYTNTLNQIPANGKRPQVLVMTFPCGDRFIPAGGDLKGLHEGAKNWMWV